MWRKTLSVSLLVLAVGSNLAAQNIVDRAGFAQAAGWDFDNAEIKTEKVGDGVWVLFGVGGNIAASIGEQGVLLVDDQFPELIASAIDCQHHQHRRGRQAQHTERIRNRPQPLWRQAVLGREPGLMCCFPFHG
jgi:hypothetical protein